AGGDRLRRGRLGRRAAATRPGAGGRGRGHLRRPLAPFRAGRHLVYPHLRPAPGRAGARRRRGRDRGGRRGHARRRLGHRADRDGPGRRPGLRPGAGHGGALRGARRHTAARGDDARLRGVPGGMSGASPPRAGTWAPAGNLAVAALLLLAAFALLPLHGGDWWPAAPRPSRRWLAAAVAVAYLAFALPFLWRRRTAATPPLPAGGPTPLLVAWGSQTGLARGLAERSAQALRPGRRQVLVLPLGEGDPERLAAAGPALFAASTR